MVSSWLLRNSKTVRLVALCGTVFIVLASGFITGMKLEEETR